MTAVRSPYFRRTASARQKYGPRADRYFDMLAQGDPLADNLVALFARLAPGEGYRLLRQALDHGIDTVPDAPDELRALFAAIDHVPEWVNWEQLDQGGAVFLRSGVLGVFTIALSSLPLSYSSPAGNKPLTLTGRLDERGMRRLGETGHYVYLASLPGGLRRFSDGFKATVKVRVMHAQVRSLARRSEKWRDELWGAPINQCYMAATVLLLSKGLLQGMERFGLRFSTTEREALIHLWRYAGHLLGIAPEFQCANEAEAAQLLEMVFEHDAPPDQDARQLIRALMAVSQKLGLGRWEWLPNVFYGISQGLIGADRARALRYPDTAWRLLVPTMRPAIRAIDTLRRLAPGSDRLLNALGRKGWRYVVDLTLGEGGQPKQGGTCPFHSGPAKPRPASAPAFDFFTVEVHRKEVS